jgi:predicted permease
MRRTPFFVLFVVFTLALGIGANTTVFTVINTLILNPLPVPDSAGLYSLGLSKNRTTGKNGPLGGISYADFKDYRSRGDAFQSLAAYTSPRLLTWQTGKSSQRVFAEMVTGNYFSTLGLTPVRGRVFLPEEDSVAGAHPVAVLNYGTWQTRFGAVADIVGRTVRLNNMEFSIIGVAPPGFIGINALFGPDLWIPASMSQALLPSEMDGVLTNRAKAMFQGVGRLKPGSTPGAAQANLAVTSAALASEYPDTDKEFSAVLQPIRDALFASASTGTPSIVYATIALLVVAALVLLIACSNVANLLLARAASRQHEISIRLALGASRSRLIRQLLTESVLLALLSGAAGFVVAYGGLRLLFGALPAAANFVAPKLDATVLLFSLFVSVVAGLLFGIIPALKTSHAGVAEALKEEARTVGASRRKITVANVLLISQIAFSFLLLVTAVLFLRSLGSAYRFDPGFQTAHLAVLMTSPGQAGYSRPQSKTFYREAQSRIAHLPGVASLSWASNLPLWARAMNGLRVEGHQERSKSDVLSAIVNTVDLNYFGTAGVAIVNGRNFNSSDRDTSTPVAIVNQMFVRDFWPGGAAIGRRIQIPGEQTMRQIVGVARTANYTTWAEPPQLCVYVPLEQHFSDSMILYVRTKGDPRPLLTPIEQAARNVGPQLFLGDIRSGSQIVDGGLFQAKMGVAMLSVFGFLALVLASIGLYGLMAYSVSRRKREIGLRMALGAARGAVLKLVLRQGMTLVSSGLVIGFAAAVLTGRLLSGMLYGIGGSDPESMAAAALVLLVAAFLACYLPARRASRVDPLVALRDE